MLGLVSIVIVLLMAVAAQNALCADDPHVSFTKTVAPVTPAECNKWLVTVTAAGVGTYNNPVDVVLVIDRSGSMSGQRMTDAKAAAVGFANRILGNGNPNDNSMALVSYAGQEGSVDVTTNVPYGTKSLTTVTNAINGLVANGGTDTAAAIRTAGNLFPDSPPCGRIQALIFLSDGVPTLGSPGTDCDWDGDTGCGLCANYYVSCTADCCNSPSGPNCCTNKAISYSSTAKARANVYSIGLVAGMTSTVEAVATEVFMGIQDSGYYRAPSSDDLDDIYEEIAGELQQAATNVAVTENVDSVGSDFNIVGTPTTTAGTATVSGNVITWNGFNVAFATPATMTYTVTPKSGVCGDQILGGSSMTYTTVSCTSNTLTATSAPTSVSVTCLTAAISPDPTVVCQGSTLELNGNPSLNGVPLADGATGYTHEWTGTGAIYLSEDNIQKPIFQSNAPPGSHTLTYTVTDSRGCTATDTNTIVVQAGATAAAGPDQTICAGSTATLAGSASNYDEVTWSGGSGTFAPNANTLNAVYTPSASEVTAGTVDLTLTATAKPPCSVDATDTVTITIQAGATAAAGPDQTICAGSTVTLAGSASNHNGIAWSGGSGTYAPNANTLNAVYTPSASEIAAGSAELTLTATAISPCSLDATDKVKITIHSEPTVNAGPDQTVCKGSTVQLAGSASNHNGVTWSGGSGSFSPDATTLNAVYTPSAAELAAGSPITLTLTATGISPCPDRYDQMVITMQGGPTAVAPGPQRICSADLSLELTGTAENFAPGSLSWTIISGPGTVTQSITDPKKATYSVDPTYYQDPDANPPYTETVVRFAATGISPCTNTVHSDVTIRVDQRPIANIEVLVP